jgi:iron(III) transport system permease protein
VAAGLARIHPSTVASARTLGETTGGVARRVQAPLLTGSLLTAAMLIFIDVLKELPATLILRPFNFDTLAVLADAYARDERLGQAAWPSLAVAALATPCIVWLTRRISRSVAGAPS